MNEKTFVMIKPDAVRRRLIGEIINRFEKDPILNIKEIKMMKVSKELAEKNYGEHQGKEFYDRLINFIISGPVVAMIVEGESAISHIRELIGATDPSKAASGTIRGDLKEVPVKSVTENLIHTSDSKKAAERELNLFFP
ncbi:MAG: nucleoside-diphosphate kinase [Promethearchaeota archaeon]